VVSRNKEVRGGFRPDMRFLGVVGGNQCVIVIKKCFVFDESFGRYQLTNHTEIIRQEFRPKNS